MMRYKFKKGFYSLTCLALAGCVQTTATVMNTPQKQVSRRVVSVPASNYYRFVDKIIKKDSDVIMSSWQSVNVDCSTNTYQVLKIRKAPVHGTAYLGDYFTFPQFVELNPRFHCNTVKLPATALHYRPAAGYTGFDLVLVDVGDSTGTVSNIAFRIKIVD